MRLDTTRLRLGDVVAGVSGAILLLSLFLTWYSRDEGFVEFDYSGWAALSFIDVLLFLAAAVAVAVAVLRALGALPPRLPVSPGLAVLALGGLALLLVLFRLADVPDYVDLGLAEGVSRGVGIFLALLAAAGVALGGWLTWNEEGRPRPETAGLSTPPGTLGSQPGPAPPPPPPPPAAAQQPDPPPPPGGAADWYPDPRGEKRLRYYDGAQWTHHVAD